jgi:hypothetical protein
VILCRGASDRTVRGGRAEAARAPVSVSISRKGVIYLEREPVDAARLAGVGKLAIAVTPRETRR